jgi:hypothetical protein
MNPTRIVAVCASVCLLAACGGGGGGEATPPTITTVALPDAVAGSAYSLTLQAQDGTPPFTWSISSQLTWLTIEPTTGTLGGMPPAVAAAVGISVQVDDANGQRDTRVLELEVVECASGTTGICYYSDDTACYVGEHVCTDGAWEGACDPPDIGQVYSTQFAHCGATCGSCSTASDNCTYGLCKCGEADPCTGGTACCAEGCHDLASDVNHCGTCGRACTLTTEVHAIPICSDGECGSRCQPGYADCSASPGCETSVTTNGNCGSCGHVCTGSYACTNDGGTYRCCGIVGYPAVWECY